MNMFYDARFAGHFVACWKRIATRFAGRKGIFGFDLINEPTQTRRALPDCDYWNLQRRAAEAVRAIDPKTPIIIESNGWASSSGFRCLSPLAMDNVIYQAHLYDPHQFTHQGVGGRWNRTKWPDAEKGWNRSRMERLERRASGRGSGRRAQTRPVGRQSAQARAALGAPPVSRPVVLRLRRTGRPPLFMV